MFWDNNWVIARVGLNISAFSKNAGVYTLSITYKLSVAAIARNDGNSFGTADHACEFSTAVKTNTPPSAQIVVNGSWVEIHSKNIIE